MIGRRAATALGDMYEGAMTIRSGKSWRRTWKVEDLYAFLYDHDQQPWLCNAMVAEAFHLKHFIRRLHTGESIVAGEGTTWEAKQRSGQGFLFNLSEIALAHGVGKLVADDTSLEPLRRALELDGYVFQRGKLVKSEGEAKEAEEERGELIGLYASLGLRREELVKRCLVESEMAYSTSLWQSCLANTRNAFEAILEDVAKAWSAKLGDKRPLLTIPPSTPAAGVCRTYLKEHGFISQGEWEALKALHGLLSNTGSHPNMTEAEQARIFRRLGLTMGLFLLLRYQVQKSEEPAR